MPITQYGMGPTINATQWSKLLQYVGDGGGMTVRSGLQPTVATGTRLIQVTSGEAAAAGVLVESSGTETITLDANSGSTPRIDVVVLDLNWSAGTAALAAVKGTPGTSPVAPTLTQSPGVRWQIPLARVTVRAGIGQIAAADLRDVRPLRSRSGITIDAASGWTLSGISYTAVGSVAQLAGVATRTGATIMPSAFGDIANSIVGILPDGAKPRSTTSLGTSASGRLASWWVSSATGAITLSAVSAGNDEFNGAIISGHSLSFAGAYLLADD